MHHLPAPTIILRHICIGIRHHRGFPNDALVQVLWSFDPSRKATLLGGSFLILPSLQNINHLDSFICTVLTSAWFIQHTDTFLKKIHHSFRNTPKFAESFKNRYFRVAESLPTWRFEFSWHCPGKFQHTEMHEISALVLRSRSALRIPAKGSFPLPLSAFQDRFCAFSKIITG